jgi:predicted TIM-barrel fold metal-dependent hydrolase
MSDVPGGAEVIDAQLHEPAVVLSWEIADVETRRELLTELQIGYMRAIGVDRALLFPRDLGWAEQAAAQYPDRFGLVPMVTDAGSYGGIDASAPDIEEIVAVKRNLRGIAGIRIVRSTPSANGEPVLVPLERFDRAVAAAARAGLPIFMSTAGDLSAPRAFAGRHPELTVIVDHLGLRQEPSYRREQPNFGSLPALLALAELPNVMVKLSGAPCLSDEPYPFDDLWPHLHAVLDAFGPRRLMWGSDISRVLGRIGFGSSWLVPDATYRPHTYAEALFYLRETDELTPEEKCWILGRTAATVAPWQAKEAA